MQSMMFETEQFEVLLVSNEVRNVGLGARICQVLNR